MPNEALDVEGQFAPRLRTPRLWMPRLRTPDAEAAGLQARERRGAV